MLTLSLQKKIDDSKDYSYRATLQLRIRMTVCSTYVLCTVLKQIEIEIEICYNTT